MLFLQQKESNTNTVIFNNCTFVGFYAQDVSILYSVYSKILFDSCYFAYAEEWSEDLLLAKAGTLMRISTSDVMISNCEFKNLLTSENQATIFDVEKSNILSIKDSSFSNFYLSSPCILLSSIQTFLVSDCIFSDIFFSFNSYLSTNERFFKITNAMNATFKKIIAKNLQLKKLPDNDILEILNNGFIMAENSFLSVFDSEIENVLAVKGSFIFALNTTIQLFNTSFLYLRAIFDGGVLLSKDSLIQIEGCNFTNCLAKGIGGAIFSLLPDFTDRNFVILSNFYNNSAQIGGAIYYKIRVLEIDLNTVYFTENKAVYGKSRYSYPRKLELVEYPNLTKLNDSLSSFRPGGLFPNLTFFLLDEENNRINSSNPFSPLLIELTPNSSYKNNLAGLNNKLKLSLDYSIEDFSFKIRGMQLFGDRESTTIVSFYHPDIKVPLKKINNFTNMENLLHAVHFRNCQIGELDKRNSTLECEVCKPGFYSFSTSDLICKECLRGLVCNETGITYVLAGYWRDEIYSEVIESCEDYPLNCIGGVQAGNSLCSEGHIGALCASCDLMKTFWSKNYARSSGSQCIDCSRVKWNYVILFVLSLLNFISIFLAIRGIINTVKNIIQTKALKALAKYMLFDDGEKMSSIYLKIYLSYFQIIKVITTFDLSIPSWLQQTPETVGEPVSSALYSFDCAIPQFTFNISYLYFKLIFTLLIPIFYLVIFGGSFLLLAFIKGLKNHFSYIYTVCLFILINYQPDIVQQLIEVLSCKKIGGKYYIQSDYNFECYTDEFYFFTLVLVIPALIFWVFLVPGLILIYLFVYRHQLDETKHIIRLGYVYQEYEIYFWEFLKMYQKMLIVFFLQFYNSEIMIKGILILGVECLYFVFLSKYNPFSLMTLNKLEKLTTLIIFFSIIFALVGNKQNNHTYLISISYASLAILNVLYNGLMLFFIISSFFEEYTEILKFKFLKVTKRLGIKNYFNIRELNPRAREKWKLAKRLVCKHLREKARNKKNEPNSNLEIELEIPKNKEEENNHLLIHKTDNPKSPEINYISNEEIEEINSAVKLKINDPKREEFLCIETINDEELEHLEKKEKNVHVLSRHISNHIKIIKENSNN